jgi:membrane fusion protein (multidrug efflux system)
MAQWMQTKGTLAKMLTRGNNMESTRVITTKTKLILLAATISLSAVLSGCGSAEATDDTEQKKETVIAVPVEVAELRNGSISSNYATTAVLEAKEEAFVVARASGIIEYIYVEEGDCVEKGQKLAHIEPER